MSRALAEIVAHPTRPQSLSNVAALPASPDYNEAETKTAKLGSNHGRFKKQQICSRRRQSAHLFSFTEISADCRRRLRFLESTLVSKWPIGLHETLKTSKLITV